MKNTAILARWLISRRKEILVVEVMSYLQNVRSYCPVLFNHSVAVANFSLKLSHLNGVNDHIRQNIVKAALLHDIGKITLDKAIIHKKVLFRTRSGSR
ncbi:HD domain-containing protein [Thermanaeromonas toyohensis]|uniref:HD domain-containing protein n=1 Tax=Thermanaeromonas toyohensis TaxID=161154 RepID=UPI0012F4BA44|nr:HD domain-containing protein [Thermanaeromonas toyohensis]